MSKSFIGFSHTMCIFFLFESPTLSLACGNDFIGELVGHTSAVSFPAVFDQPLHTQGYFSIMSDFGRNLESCATNTTATDLHAWRNVTQCSFPYIIPIFTSLLGHFIYRGIKDIECTVLFSLPHNIIYKTRNLDVVIFCIRR